MASVSARTWSSSPVMDPETSTMTTSCGLRVATPGFGTSSDDRRPHLALVCRGRFEWPAPLAAAAASWRTSCQRTVGGGGLYILRREGEYEARPASTPWASCCPDSFSSPLSPSPDG